MKTVKTAIMLSLMTGSIASSGVKLNQIESQASDNLRRLDVGPPGHIHYKVDGQYQNQCRKNCIAVVNREMCVDKSDMESNPVCCPTSAISTCGKDKICTSQLKTTLTSVKYNLCPRESSELIECGTKLLQFTPKDLGKSKRVSENSDELDFIRQRTIKKGSLCTYVIEMKDNVATDTMDLYIQDKTNVRITISQYRFPVDTNQQSMSDMWSKSSTYDKNFISWQSYKDSTNIIKFKQGLSTFAFMTVYTYDTRYEGKFEFKIRTKFKDQIFETAPLFKQIDKVDGINYEAISISLFILIAGIVIACIAKKCNDIKEESHIEEIIRKKTLYMSEVDKENYSGKNNVIEKKKTQRSLDFQKFPMSAEEFSKLNASGRPLVGEKQAASDFQLKTQEDYLKGPNQNANQDDDEKSNPQNGDQNQALQTRSQLPTQADHKEIELVTIPPININAIKDQDEKIDKVLKSPNRSYDLNGIENIKKVSEPRVEGIEFPDPLDNDEKLKNAKKPALQTGMPLQPMFSEISISMANMSENSGELKDSGRIISSRRSISPNKNSLKMQNINNALDRQIGGMMIGKVSNPTQNTNVIFENLTLEDQ